MFPHLNILYSSNLSNTLIHQIVGFGGDGPTHPLPLIHGQETPNLGTQTVRLMHIPLPCNLDQSQKWWVYQYRNSTDQEWNTFYAFSGMEFTAADFNVMNVSFSLNLRYALSSRKEQLLMHFSSGPAKANPKRISRLVQYLSSASYLANLKMAQKES